jgi:hypothetical protein
MSKIFFYSKWLELPLATRQKLAQVFNIPKTGATEVSSNIIVKDGYAVKDIEEKMSIEAMQDYLGAVDGGDDLSVLFDQVVEKAIYVPTPPMISQEVVVKTTVTETVVRPVDTIKEVTKQIEEVPLSQDQLPPTTTNEIKHDEKTKKGGKK